MLVPLRAFPGLVTTTVGDGAGVAVGGVGRDDDMLGPTPQTAAIGADNGVGDVDDEEEGEVGLGCSGPGDTDDAEGRDTLDAPDSSNGEASAEDVCSAKGAVGANVGRLGAFPPVAVREMAEAVVFRLVAGG